MEKHTNPRKVGRTGNMNYVSLPDGFLDVVGLEVGDRVVLHAEDGGFRAEKVEWRRASE